MQHTFGLIVPGAVITSIVNSTPIVQICGSLPELGSGSIEKAPKLTLLTKEFYQPVTLINEPRFYRLDINLSKDVKEFDYKYVINDTIWEGKRDKPRKWSRDDCKNLIEEVYYTPIDYWMDVDSDAPDESKHTMRFYQEVFAHKAMHYGRVNDQLYVGSCPRATPHIQSILSKELGITAVINLQVKKDIDKNCQAILGDNHAPDPNNEYDIASVDILRKVYEKAGILFIWLPIIDMSSTGRELMLPQAALVLKTMLGKGHKVYVHCNAGVGRAFGLICAYQHFLLKTPLSKVHYELAPIRSCGYFDPVSLEYGRKIYKNAFE